MNQLKVFTAFSGYDSQCMALDRLGINYDLVGWSEIDKYAIQAHNAVYPQYAGRNFGDISTIDWRAVPAFNLFTYSFPCQDISNAGAQRGLKEGSGTRSSLLWECKRAIEAKRPKYLLMENVKALTAGKFLPFLNQWADYLHGLGYKNFTRVLNAKNYGIPQNRERVFMVSVLDQDAVFNFPGSLDAMQSLADILETEVGDVYYLSQETLEKFSVLDPQSEISFTEKLAIGYSRSRQDTGKIDRYTLRDTVNTIHQSTGTGGNTDCFIAEPLRIPQATKKGYTEVMPGGVFDGSYPNSKTRRGRVQENGSVTPTITAGGDTLNVYEGIRNGAVRVRKLTERECFRLMGVTDKNVDLIQAAGISRTRQHRLAGNSIVVDVLYYIFKNLLGQATRSDDELLDDIEAWEDM